MGDRSLICLADYEETIDEWGTLFLYNRWAGKGGYHRFLLELGRYWKAHKADGRYAPQFNEHSNDDEMFADLLPSKINTGDDMPTVARAGPFACCGPDYDIMVVDVHNKSCFMLPSDAPDTRETIMGMLRSGGGDRWTFDEIEGGALFGPALEWHEENETIGERSERLRHLAHREGK